MKKLMVSLVLVAVLVLLFFAFTVTVDETESVIVLRFGDPRRVIDEAGLHFRWPPPIDTVRRIDRRIHVLDPDPDEILTSDKKNILVNSFLVWAVEDPKKFLVSVGDLAGAEARLTAVLRSEVGTTLGSYPLSSLITEEEGEGTEMASVMDRIAAAAAGKARNSFGIRVTAIRIKRINFPNENKRAVFQRMEAERKRIAKGFRSEGEEEADKIRARADREKAVLLAEAKRQAAVKRGQADAEAARIYAEAFEKDPEFFEFVRSLEAYGKIIDENSTVVIPDDSPLLRVLTDPERYLRKADAAGAGNKETGE
ncbi:MAG: protease modulator HflC [Planctomycetota bacterium]